MLRAGMHARAIVKLSFNALEVRFSATLGGEREVEVSLLLQLGACASLGKRRILEAYLWRPVVQSRAEAQPIFRYGGRLVKVPWDVLQPGEVDDRHPTPATPISMTAGIAHVGSSSQYDGLFTPSLIST
jgi:hypothetical protein